ncbi:acyltransferase [Sulfurimonas sp. HSL-1656]|uniref:acyltransferase family protein n=1 Tax=Thiomicrolovo subterrani TaxID=3131934 RepID=UPI0031F9A88E
MQQRNYSGTNFVTGLRFIAVFLVFLIHSGGAGLREYSLWTSDFVSYGQNGVEVFFVISGFTIFYQIFEKNYEFKKFLQVRIIRISLVYFPILLFLYVVYKTTGVIVSDLSYKLNNGVISLENLLVHMVYLGFLDVKYANTIIGVEWTLNVEVFYYILLGYLIYKGLLRGEIKNTVYYLVVFLLLSFIVAIISYKHMIDPLWVNWMPFYYGYMFILGGFAYSLRKHITESFNSTNLSLISNSATAIAIILWLGLALNHTYFPAKVSGGLTALIVFILLLFTRDNSVFSFLLNNKVFIFIGSLSYSFYLLHMICIYVVKEFIIEPFGVFLVSFMMTLFVSYISYELLEIKAYIKLKSFVLKKR